jgi:hypothetical protein
MDHMEPARKSNHPVLRHRAKLLITLGIILLVSALAFDYSVSKVNQPVEGTIVHAAQSPTKEAAPASKDLSTVYYSISYPARYELLPAPTPSASLDAEILSAQAQPGFGVTSKLLLTVTDLPVGGVTEDSSYKLFEAEPDIYSFSQETRGSDTTYVAIRAEPDYQKTILWPHGSHLLTITLVTGAQSETTDADLQTVLTNLKWLTP